MRGLVLRGNVIEGSIRAGQELLVPTSNGNVRALVDAIELNRKIVQMVDGDGALLSSRLLTVSATASTVAAAFTVSLASGPTRGAPAASTATSNSNDFPFFSSSFFVFHAHVDALAFCLQLNSRERLRDY